MAEITNAPSTPPVPVVRSQISRKFYWIILGIVVIVIAVIGIAFMPVGSDRLWHRLFAVHALQGFRVAKGNAEPVKPYTFGVRGLKPYTVADATGILGDFAQANGTRVIIARANASSSEQVQELAPVTRTLSTEAGVKSLAAVSPNEAFVAYAVSTSTEEYSWRLSAWDVKFVTLSTGATIDLGAGFDPQFFGRDGKIWLLYTSTKGVTIMNVATLKSFTTPYAFGDDTGFAVQIAADGAHVALRDPAAAHFGLYSVYRLGSDISLGINPMPADFTQSADIKLTTTAAYGTTVIGNSGIVQIYQFPYTSPDKPSLLYTFPADHNYRFVQ